jgi:flagellar biosynthetic protein FliQ
MNDASVVQIGLDAMLLAFKLAAPVLIVSLAVGLGIGLVQSVTQLQEPTLTFVPKFACVGIVILVGGNWMLHEMVSFTTMLFARIPELLR